MKFYEAAAAKAVGYEFSLPAKLCQEPIKKVIQRVNLGRGQTPKNLPLNIAEKPEEPLFRELYQDARTQYILKEAPKLQDSYTFKAGI